MGKLALSQRVSDEYSKRTLYELMLSVETQVNMLTEGKASAVYNAYTSAPTTGTHYVGDFIKNSAPSEQGSTNSKYVLLGWICVASGTPGTWKECRVLTGN